MNVCDAIPGSGDVGIGPTARLVVPGDPASSVISSRIHRRDALAMPPVGSALVDETGAGVVDEWITSLTGCP
jgi:hypothetical protein